MTNQNSLSSAAPDVGAVHFAIMTRDLDGLRQAASGVDWLEYYHIRQSALRAGARFPARSTSDQILRDLMFCFALDPPAPGSPECAVEAFGAAAMDALVAAGYRALDTPDLPDMLRRQPRPPNFVSALSTACFRTGARDALRATLLHYTVDHAAWQPEIMDAVIVDAAQAGLVNAVDFQGNTVWHRWCSLHDLSIVRTDLDPTSVPYCLRGLEKLLLGGLDPDIRNAKGLTGEDCLAQRGSQDPGNAAAPELLQGWKGLLAAYRSHQLNQTLASSEPGMPRRF